MAVRNTPLIYQRGKLGILCQDSAFLRWKNVLVSDLIPAWEFLLVSFPSPVCLCLTWGVLEVSNPSCCGVWGGVPPRFPKNSMKNSNSAAVGWVLTSRSVPECQVLL